MLLKYVQEESNSLNKKLKSLFPGCAEYGAEEIRRIWRKYVHPKVHLFNDEEIRQSELLEKKMQVYGEWESS